MKEHLLLQKWKKISRQYEKMVMDSYQDMLAGKGRDCKEFFDELESRYKNAKI